MSLSVKRDDTRLEVKDITYPGEAEEVKAHYARPKRDEKLPGVLVISEIWGLIPHIEDITRRVALEGFLAIAPDPLTHLGGTPEDPDEAVKMMREKGRGHWVLLGWRDDRTGRRQFTRCTGCSSFLW